MLRTHDIVCSSVGLASDHRQLGYTRLGIGIEELGPVANDPTVLLPCPWQEPRHVHEGDERDVEGVAESDESSGFHGAVDVQAAGELHRLVCDHPDGTAAHPAEPRDNVACEIRLNLEEVAFVNDVFDDDFHVVRDIWVRRDETSEHGALSVGGVVRG